MVFCPEHPKRDQNLHPYQMEVPPWFRTWLIGYWDGSCDEESRPQSFFFESLFHALFLITWFDNLVLFCESIFIH